MAANIFTPRRAKQKTVSCLRAFQLLAVFGLLSGCALPTVELATPEPVKVDINVRLDVYQHGEQQETPANTASDTAATPNLEQRRRNRMGDIQLFKNSRIVGENHQALLEVKELPPGEYGDYVKQVVSAENEDRLTLMQGQAEASGLQLEAVQQERAKLWRNQSFQGEWIEVPDPSGNGFLWVQKGSDL